MASLSFSLTEPSMVKASASPTATLSVPETLDEQFGIELNSWKLITSLLLSLLRLGMPDAHVTSYKPKVSWKEDAFEEVPFRVTADGADPTKTKGNPKLTGAALLELLSINYIISLNPLSMATAGIVKNNGRKDMTLTSAIFSNVKFKKRGGTAVQGLRGCSYCTHPPRSSFDLLSPSEAMQSQPEGWFGLNSEEKHGVIWETEGCSSHYLEAKAQSGLCCSTRTETKHKSFCNTPSSKYETLVRVENPFFKVIRIGFEDIYTCSVLAPCLKSMERTISFALTLLQGWCLACGG